MKSLLAALVLLIGPALAQTVPSSGLPNTTCEYPAAAVSVRAEGRTLVVFLPMPDGTLLSVTILKSSGNTDLDNAAVTCVENWRFDPKSSADRSWVDVRGAYISWTMPDDSTGKPLGKRSGVPHSCAFAYPKEARKDRLAGTTKVRFVITDRGRVTDPQIVESSGSVLLDNAALRCVGYWRYVPAVKDGQNVEASWTVSIPWSVDGPIVVVE